jgi:hypothetical protein
MPALYFYKLVPIMKTTLHLITLAIGCIALSSCCSTLLRGGTITAEKEVTTFTQVQGSVDPVPVTTTKRVSKRFDINDPKVLARASAQGSSGEPNIGLIPTMKDLATSD